MPHIWSERLAAFPSTLFSGVGVLANRCSKRNLCATAFIVVSLAFVNDCGYKPSVKDFGAIGNGTADDRRAIQATIDDGTAQGGGVVYFLAGSYKISIYTPGPGQFPWPRALTIRPNITLQAVGANSSTIKLANNQVPYGAPFAPEPLDSDVSGSTMYDLGADLNGLNNPLPTATEINEQTWRAPRGDVLLLDPKTKFLSLVPTPGEIAPQYQTTVISSDDVAATAGLKGSHEQEAPTCSS
jgi:hypothetical protein